MAPLSSSFFLRTSSFLLLGLAAFGGEWAGPGGVEAGLGPRKPPPPKYSISAALTYLGKAVLTSALLQGNSFTIEDDLVSASYQDSSDCVKRLICELRSKPRGQLAWDEDLIMGAIPSRLDYASPIIQLMLAADLGNRMPDQCGVVYSRCSFNGEDIMKLMRQRGTSLTIPTDPEYECTVLFLWNRKYDTGNDTEESSLTFPDFAS